MSTNQSKRWLRRNQVAEKLSVSYSHLRLTLEEMPDFPKPIVLSPKVVVFDEAEIDAWMDAQRVVDSEAKEVA